MTDRGKIISIYVIVAILSIGVLGTSFWIRNYRKRTYPAPTFDDAGKKEATDFGELEKDLELVNQDGERVKLSALKDKVWVATNFFAACPDCAATASRDLQRLYKEFSGNPDFHIVSIAVNPDDDTEILEQYREKMNADSRNWWFLSGPAEVVHEYVEKEMKFMRVVKNDDDSVRLYLHDLGLQVYARDWQRVKKRDLHYARQQGEVEHEASFQEVRASVLKSLAASKSP